MIRTFEAGIAITIMLLLLVQVLILSAGRLGEQWDSTGLDVEVKKALQGLQTEESLRAFSRYSKIGDPDLLRIPQAEGIGYRILVDGQEVDTTLPPADVEVAASDARIYQLSRDAARLVRSLHERLLRCEYVAEAGATIDYDTVDELADLILGIMWDPESQDVLQKRVRTLIENQNPDGGWGFVCGEESDALCTSMAVQALSAWIRKQGDSPLLNSTVSAGVSWLKAEVHADGGYGGRERLESSAEMTALTILAFVQAGLDQTDPLVRDAADYLIGLQGPDGGFSDNRNAPADPASTSLVVEALMAIGESQAVVESAVGYLKANMVDDGQFEVDLEPTGAGTYDLQVDTGYIVDCSIRGYEFWGESWDDSIIAIIGITGDRDNMTVFLRVERGKLVPPGSKQKIALCFSHNMTPDTTDWWILNAGNYHTAGQGEKIDDPKFQQTVTGAYTYLTATNLQVPAEYEFFAPSQDWLIAIVGDQPHPIKDNPGRGYLIGYWSIWMPAFDFSNVLIWRSLGSPRANRVCVDIDRDAEFDDKRLADGDVLEVRGLDWQVEINWSTTTDELVYVKFWQPDLNLSRYYLPLKYDLSTIPDSASGLYHFGVISVYNKPSFSKDYKVILRDSVEEDRYDEAYIWNGTVWSFFPPTSSWTENGILWIVGIEWDFLTLTRASPTSLTDLSGPTSTVILAEGDFIQIHVAPNGPTHLRIALRRNGNKVAGASLGDQGGSFRQVFGSWGPMRETSMAFSALTSAEDWTLGQASGDVVHYMADACQQGIKFNKAYNSVIEHIVTIEAWYRPSG